MSLGLGLGLSRNHRGGASGPTFPAGLVADYDFRDGTGQVLTDRSGNGHHAQLGATTGVDASDPTWGTTPARLILDGGDYVIPPPAVRNVFTPPGYLIATVLKAANLAGNLLFWGFDDLVTGGARKYQAVYTAPEGSIELLLGSMDATSDSVISASSIVAADTWVHIAWGFANGFMKIYANGTLVKTGTVDFTGKLFTTTDAYTPVIGAYKANSTTPTNFFPGSIARWTVFPTHADVAAVYAVHKFDAAAEGISLP